MQRLRHDICPEPAADTVPPARTILLERELHLHVVRRTTYLRPVYGRMETTRV